MSSEREEHPPAGFGPGIPVDLRDDGLLWLINTMVFHPRGFALAMTEDASRFLLLGDGSERWRFSEEGDPPNDDRFLAAEDAFKRASASVVQFRDEPRP